MVYLQERSGRMKPRFFSRSHVYSTLLISGTVVWRDYLFGRTSMRRASWERFEEHLCFGLYGHDLDEISVQWNAVFIGKAILFKGLSFLSSWYFYWVEHMYSSVLVRRGNLICSCVCGSAPQAECTLEQMTRRIIHREHFLESPVYSPLPHWTTPTPVPLDFQNLISRKPEAGTSSLNILSIRSFAPSPSIHKTVCALKGEGGADMICSQMSTRESESIALARWDRIVRQLSSCQSWMKRRIKYISAPIRRRLISNCLLQSNPEMQSYL